MLKLIRKRVLNAFTTKELKEELKRRAELVKAQKEEEMKTALRCRNCKHCTPHPKGFNFYHCAVRTYGKTNYNYSVKPSTKACELFERKEQ